jgi:transcriptional regulator with XRE-family HTH domain
MFFDFSFVTKVRNQKLLNQFGRVLKEMRISKGLSQEQLANDADIPINQIGRIERGEINPSLSTLHSIALALKIKLTELLKDF